MVKVLKNQMFTEKLSSVSCPLDTCQKLSQIWCVDVCHFVTHYCQLHCHEQKLYNQQESCRDAFSALTLLIGQKSIQPIKNWVMRCWCGFLSGVQCKWFAYGQADAMANPSSLASLKSRMVLPSWYLLIQVVLENRPLNGCSDDLVGVKNYPETMENRDKSQSGAGT